MSKKLSSYKSTVVVFSRIQLKSKAYLSLSGTAVKILNFFYMKRVYGKKRNGQDEPPLLNDGEIIFTYDEAVKLGFSKRAFRDAIDRLIESGFIAINHHGGGLNKDYTTYFMSKMWFKYKTHWFRAKKRPENKRLSGIMIEVRKKRKQKQVTKANPDK